MIKLILRRRRENNIGHEEDEAELDNINHKEGG